MPPRKATKKATAVAKSRSDSNACPNCGADMKIRESKYGPFKGCTAYPKCKTTVQLTAEEKAKLGYKAAVRADQTKNQRPTFAASGEQQAAINAVGAGERIVGIDAGAGCGKTTLQRLVAWSQENVKTLAVAYNSAIVTALTDVMPAWVTCKSTHQASMMLLSEIYHCKIIPDKDRLDNRFLDKLYPFPQRERGVKRSAADKMEFARAVTARSFLSNAIGKFKALLMDTKSGVTPNGESIWQICDRFRIDLPEEITTLDRDTLIRQAFELLEPSSEIEVVQSRSGMRSAYVDFDTMLYAAGMFCRMMLEWHDVKGTEFPFKTTTFDLVLGDEAQDWNTAQHYLVLGLAGFHTARPGQIVYVGDPRQAIYGFRGADYRSMQTFKELCEKYGKRTAVSLPLMSTRRCPKAVVRHANQIEPRLVALDDAPEGFVEFITELPMREIMGSPNDWMISSRVNAPLVGLAYEFWKARVPCRIQGREFGKAILTVLLSGRWNTPQEMIDILREKIQRESEKDKPDETVVDKYECLCVLGAEVGTLDELEELLDALFSDSGAGVLLTTIHRSKGLERRFVVCVPAHAPHPMARTPEAYEQEMNLLYVQWTRAMEGLYIIPDRKQPYWTPENDATIRTMLGLAHTIQLTAAA